MFINISNHHSSSWSSVQLNTAKSFGSHIYDIPFPVVPPEANSNIIAKMADEILLLIYELQVTVIHVMGEHTLNHALVERFKKSGYRTIASTTHRVSEVLPDGSKISKFEFVRFRDY